MPRRNPSCRSASFRKVRYSFSQVGRPGKAFLDHASVLKLYPWAKTNIKRSNRREKKRKEKKKKKKKRRYMSVRGHHYAIPPRQTLLVGEWPSSALIRAQSHYFCISMINQVSYRQEEKSKLGQSWQDEKFLAAHHYAADMPSDSAGMTWSSQL